MSRHIFESSHRGRPVTIEIGWDEPLRHYYMQVTANGTRSRAFRQKVHPLYSNLADPAIDGGADDPAYYWNKLAVMGIGCSLRSEIDIELQLDADGGGSNRTVMYDPQTT